MKYTKYGITVSLLKESDLEMVRQWRNDPVVVSNYEYREYITPEMQKKWFKSINNLNNLYTIIEYHGEKIGIINMKDIDWVKQTGEGGIFIPDPKYHQTSLPAILSYMTTELQFKYFNWKTGYASVLKENTAGQAFVKSLGYQLCPGQEEKNNQLYYNTKETFEKYAGKIKKAIAILTEQDDISVLLIERSEFDDELVLQWERQIFSIATPDKSETTETGRIYYFS